MERLRRARNFKGPEGSVVLAILDGIGSGRYAGGDMVSRVNTPTLDWLAKHALAATLKAHGTAVGMHSDADMGNSEIGHNAIGYGQVFAQGARLVNEAIGKWTLFRGDPWQELIKNVINHNSRLHFIGLLSSGNVHSQISHMEALLTEAKKRRHSKSLCSYPSGRAGCAADVRFGIHRAAREVSD